jgi:hypothetical protein
MSRNDEEKAVSVVSFISSSLWYSEHLQSSLEKTYGTKLNSLRWTIREKSPLT